MAIDGSQDNILKLRLRWFQHLARWAVTRGCRYIIGDVVRDPLDANSRQRGRSGSLGQFTGWWRSVGGVPGRSRCCTFVLYGVQPRRGAVLPEAAD